MFDLPFLDVREQIQFIRTRTESIMFFHLITRRNYQIDINISFCYYPNKKVIIQVNTSMLCCIFDSPLIIIGIVHRLVTYCVLCWPPQTMQTQFQLFYPRLRLICIRKPRNIQSFNIII